MAVVVLTWNGKSLTLDCLKSLAALEFDNYEVFVVDNASSDGTAEAIRDKFGDDVNIIVNGDNLGFSRGNNVGIEAALATGADSVLLLNNDTIVDSRVLDKMTQVLYSAPEIGIVGPKILYSSPPNQIWFAGGEVFLARGTARHIGIREIDHGQYETIRDVDYITGCALMAKREVFETIGLLDASYQAYYEDTDFCMRARRRGYRILYIPAGIVWHKISASTGGQLSATKIKRKLKSGIKFFRRYASFYHWLTIPLFFAADVVRILVLVSVGRIRNTGDVGNAAGGNS